MSTMKLGSNDMSAKVENFDMKLEVLVIPDDRVDEGLVCPAIRLSRGFFPFHSLYRFGEFRLRCAMHGGTHQAHPEV